MNKVRMGVIGAGKMGQHHIRVLGQLPGVELVGFADPNELARAEVHKRFGAKGFADYRDLLDEGLDAVSVVVPTTVHREVAMNAIEAGCHLLVEKPLAESVASGREIIAHAKRYQRHLMVGHIERFNPAVQMLREIITDGILGEVVTISSKRVGPYPGRIQDSGIILDLAPHDVDIFCYLMDSPITQAFTIAGSRVHTHEDHASIMLRFATGQAGHIDLSWLTPHKVRELNVVGLSGVAKLDFIGQSIVVYDKSWAREAKVHKKEPLLNELEYFLEIVKGNRQPLVTGEDSLYALHVALMSIKSYQDNSIEPIRLAEERRVKKAAGN